MFTSWILVAKPEWPYGEEKKFKPKIGYMPDAITKQRGRGLSDERLIRTFVQRCLWLLTTHQRTMWQFTGDNDSDRHTTTNLGKQEFVSRVLAITVGLRQIFCMRVCRSTKRG
jgi:hypothetical protein